MRREKVILSSINLKIKDRINKGINLKRLLLLNLKITKGAKAKSQIVRIQNWIQKTQASMAALKDKKFWRRNKSYAKNQKEEKVKLKVKEIKVKAKKVTLMKLKMIKANAKRKFQLQT